MCHRIAALLAGLLLTAGAGSTFASTFPAVRVSGDGINVLGGFDSGTGTTYFRRDPFTSRGKVLFVDDDHGVWLFDGTLPPDADLVQARPGSNNVNEAVFMLGSHATAGQVLGGWRRDFDLGFVTIDGAPPSTVNLNPEAVSVSDGCAFMVLQNGADGNHAYRIDPPTGTLTQLSSGTYGPNNGAFRIASGQCRAAWTFQAAPGSAQQIVFWNGTSTTTLEPEVSSQPRMRGGWIAYIKPVSGIDQVFAVDANDPLLTKIQLSAEDGSKVISHVETDGRHVIWVRSNTDGTGKELVTAGGLVFPTGALDVLSNERGVLLDRGQLLWRSPAGVLSYDDGIATHVIDPAPATTIEVPWLADGHIAFVGLYTGSGTDKGAFRIAGTPPNDAQQPSPPLLVHLTPGNGELTVAWDRILGAASYNVYVANEPGVTKDNYLSLAGGMRIVGATSPHTIPSLAKNTPYYVAVSAVEGGIEGPSSRIASTMLLGDLAWQSVEDAGTFYSVAADPTDRRFVFAGGAGSIRRSSNGGRDWVEVLPTSTTGANRIAAIAVSGTAAFAVAVDQGDVWKSVNDGVDWTRVLDATNPGESKASIAIAPSNASSVFAGDFDLPDKEAGDSYVIESTDAGVNWTHTPEGPDELRAYALAIDPGDASIVYAGGSGTPNVAKSIDGGASWQSAAITGGGTVHSLAIDPHDSDVLYASTRDKGVFVSRDAGASWTAINTGLDGVVDEFFGGAGFNTILVDPRFPGYLHLGAGNGYWYSIDGGESWTAENDGFVAVPEIHSLTMTTEHRLLAATSDGLFLLSIAPPPHVDDVTPSTGDAGGGTNVTITGSGFQQDAVVTFGGVAATALTVVSDTTITATTPAHADGTVDVVVANYDGQSASLEDAFTYTTTPPPAPAGVVATASSTTSVSIAWTAAPRATSYVIERRAAGGSFGQIGTAPGPSYVDTTVTGSKSYLYRVAGVNGAGTSPMSSADIATTVLFSNDPIVVNVTSVRALHVTQQRTAINAVRLLASLPPATFSGNATAGAPILATHVLEMRTALDEALEDLGRTFGGYTDATLSAKTIKAAHFQEIRNRVK